MINVDFLDSLTITPGMQKRVDCPSCGGINTLSVRNEGGTYKYNCFREGCPTRGIHRASIDIDYASDYINGRPPGRQRMNTDALYDKFVPFTREVHEWYKKYPAAFEQLHEVDLRYDPKEDRAVICYGTSDSGFAAIGRSMGKSLPKWKKYGHCVLPFIHGCGRTGVIVEDAVSAIAVGSISEYTGISVLGTSLTSGIAPFMSRYTSVIIALDKDASLTSLNKFAPMLSWFVPTRTVLLQRDLKHFNKEDICQILS